MRDAEPLGDLVERLRAGDPRAAEQLFDRYARQLIRLAEQHLSDRMAGRTDGEDVVQSVFRTFFRRNGEGAFQIDSSAQLWQLLVKITLRKARAERRHHSAEKRDVSAEAPGGDVWLLDRALTHDPDPAEAAALVDQIEVLLHGLPALHCQVLELRLQGYPVADIAPELNVSRQTVYRALQLIQQRLEDAAQS